MIKFRMKLIMANQPSWRTLNEKLEQIKVVWNRAANAPLLEIDVEYHQMTPPDLNRDGNITALWMQANLGIAAKKLGYDAAVLCMNEKDNKMWAMDQTRRGHHYRSVKDMGLFWVACDEKTMYTYPSGMKINRFVKIFTHEVSHMISNHTGQTDNTHYHDYEAYDVAKAFLEYDWYRWTLLTELRKKLRSFLGLFQHE